MKKCPTCSSTYPTSYSVCPRDGTSLMNVGGWSEGTVVGGKYRIVGKIGEGAMAIVYKAVHVHFNEPRALKVMARGLTHDEAFVKRFMQEAVITRKLEHPNAVRVEDIEEAEDGVPFIVMEYIEGRSLKDLIQQEAPLPVDLVGSIVKQVAAALDAAHRLGMVHRDIKPSNIVLITSTGAPPTEGKGEGNRTPKAAVAAKVLDFGVARIKEIQRGDALDQTNLTSTGMVMGTAAYMSPEQAMGKRGDELDGRSDLYSLGVVMYQMLTGELPLKADSEIGFLMAHIQTPVPDIRIRRPDVPEVLASLVMSCLEKNRDARPATDAALIQVIEDMEEASARAARERAASEPTIVSNVPGIPPSSEDIPSRTAKPSGVPNQRAGQEVNLASVVVEAQPGAHPPNGGPRGSERHVGLIMPKPQAEPSIDAGVSVISQRGLTVVRSNLVPKLTSALVAIMTTAVAGLAKLSCFPRLASSRLISRRGKKIFIIVTVVTASAALGVGGGHLVKTLLTTHEHTAYKNELGRGRETTLASPEREGGNGDHPSSTNERPTPDRAVPSSNLTPLAPEATPAKPSTVATTRGTTDLPEPKPAPRMEPNRIRISAADLKSNLVYEVTPKYPDLARQAHVQGSVQLDAVFGTDGKVEYLKLVSGHPLLVNAAMDAVRRWRYRPTLVNGKPVEVETQVELKFTLHPVGT